ncbi:hypothetical protein ES705_37873 [subsurface metagenome]
MSKMQPGVEQRGDNGVMSLLESTARHFLIIKAAREIKAEMEKIGLDNLKVLGEAGHDIANTYIKGCSAEGIANSKQKFNSLSQMGVTADMIITELTRQMPELVPIMERREGYIKKELEKLISVLQTQ